MVVIPVARTSAASAAGSGRRLAIFMRSMNPSGQ
jgi:hypothetical protein